MCVRVSLLKPFAFSETFTILHSFRFFAMDFAPRRKISSLHPVPVKGRFRERQEAVRDATGPSRLSKSLRLVLRRIGRNRSRVTYGSRGRTAQGSSNAVEARIQSRRRRVRCRWELQAVNPARAERRREDDCAPVRKSSGVRKCTSGCGQPQRPCVPHALSGAY